MKVVGMALLGCLLRVGSGQADDPKDDKAPDKAKLYGTWEVLKGGGYPPSRRPNSGRND
jgi:hypothetical protein